MPLDVQSHGKLSHSASHTHDNVVDAVRRAQVLAIDEAIAEESACRIEHAAPPEVIDSLIRFVDFIEESLQPSSTDIVV